MNQSIGDGGLDEKFDCCLRIRELHSTQNNDLALGLVSYVNEIDFKFTANANVPDVLLSRLAYVTT